MTSIAGRYYVFTQKYILLRKISINPLDNSALLTNGYLLGGPEEEVEDDGKEACIQAVHGG